MKLSDWWDESFSGPYCVCVCLFSASFVTFCLFFFLLLTSPFMSLNLFVYLPFLQYNFLCPCLFPLLSISFSVNLNSITKLFYWLASLKINLDDESETLMLYCMYHSLPHLPPPPPLTHTHTDRLRFPQMWGFGIPSGRPMKKSVWIISTRMLVLPAERRFNIDIWYSYSVISDVFLSPFYLSS